MIRKEAALKCARAILDADATDTHVALVASLIQVYVLDDERSQRALHNAEVIQMHHTERTA
jgi:hypothetical protein